MQWLTDGLEEYDNQQDLLCRHLLNNSSTQSDCNTVNQSFHTFLSPNITQATANISQSQHEFAVQSLYNDYVLQHSSYELNNANISHILLDLTSTLFSWHPHEALKTQYPSGITDMIYDEADPYNVPFFERFRCTGWPVSWVLEQYARDHGPAVAWVYRMLIEHEAEGFVYESNIARLIEEYLTYTLGGGIDTPGTQYSAHKLEIANQTLLKQPHKTNESHESDWGQIINTLHSRGIFVRLVAQTSVRTYSNLCERYPWLQEFDGVIFTQKAQALLDNQRFYKYVCSMYGVPAETTLLISSNTSYCAAARAAGLLDWCAVAQRNII